MNVLKSKLFQMGAVLAVVGTIAVTTPRAAHAVAAALVQITNTTANPGITQDATLAASQIVTLGIGPADLETGSEPMQQYLPGSGLTGTAYVVPAGQHLVITGLDVQIYFGSGTLSLGPGGGVGPVENFNLQSAQGTQQFQFPAGFVFPAGSNVVVGMNSGSVWVVARGYLTAN